MNFDESDPALVDDGKTWVSGSLYFGPERPPWRPTEATDPYPWCGELTLVDTGRHFARSSVYRCATCEEETSGAILDRIRDDARERFDRLLWWVRSIDRDPLPHEIDEGAADGS